MSQSAIKSLEEAKREANYRTAIMCIQLGGISKEDIAYATDLPLITIEDLYRKHRADTLEPEIYS